MLWLIVGGANQGKSELLRTHVAAAGAYEIDAGKRQPFYFEEISGEIADLVSRQRVVIYNFDRILVEASQHIVSHSEDESKQEENAVSMYGYHAGGGLELVDQILTWIGSIAEERDIFLEATECGSGIVPLLKEDRLRRELTGRLLTKLATAADGVVRVFCGIPEVIKEPAWPSHTKISSNLGMTSRLDSMACDSTQRNSRPEDFRTGDFDDRDNLIPGEDWAFSLYLVRHGMTEFNQQRKYLGTGDMGINERGRQELQDLYDKNHFPAVDFLYSSPLKRCLESAAVAWPDHPIDVIDSNFRERNFGDFEGLAYADLCVREDYCRWLEGEGRSAPPGGESGDSIERRVSFGITELIRNCLRIYRWNYWGWLPRTSQNRDGNLAEDLHYTVGLMCHGGVIMEIMRILGFTDFYAWQVTNGSWVRLRFKYDGELIDEMPLVGGKSAGG